jgi:hypothetical protein
MPYEVLVNPAAVRLGPGVIFFATDLAAVEPTDLTTPWAAAWTQAGPTQNGNEVTYTVNTDPVRIAERLAELSNVPTSTEMVMSFDLAETTAKNMQRALNGGTITTAAGAVTFDPPLTPGSTRIKIGWESDDGLERYFFRRCFNVGGLTLTHRPGADYGVVPMQYRIEAPGGTTRPWRYIGDTTLQPA